MANEINNISHAGISIDVGPGTARLLSSWGIRESTFGPDPSLGVGVYTAELLKPASGLVGAGFNVEETDYLLLFAGNAFPNAWGALLRQAIGVLPVPGKRLQLPLLLMQIVTPAGAGIDGSGNLSVEVRSVPQQD